MWGGNLTEADPTRGLRQKAAFRKASRVERRCLAPENMRFELLGKIILVANNKFGLVGPIHSGVSISLWLFKGGCTSSQRCPPFYRTPIALRKRSGRLTFRSQFSHPRPSPDILLANQSTKRSATIRLDCTKSTNTFTRPCWCQSD